jgi:VIT1/CCC1 family predicted Fe2+/Mn2+ transporter
MRAAIRKKRELIEKHNKSAALFREFILGGQDGLVNVLGIILGLAVATGDAKIVIIAGLAAAFAESISMGAVAYTSTKAMADYYESEKAREKYEMQHYPRLEKDEIYDIYRKKGFKGNLLKQIVDNITSSRKRWLDIMMKEELNLTKEIISPAKAALIVLASSLIGSFIPLMPFFFMQIKTAILSSLAASAVALFITGAIEARLTVGNFVGKGIQLMLIGMLAAFIGFIVGKVFGFSS